MKIAKRNNFFETISSISVYIGNCLLIVWFSSASIIESIRRIDNIKWKKSCSKNECNYLEFCFEQWSELVNRRKLSVSKVDEYLSCARLGWQRRSGIEGQFSAGIELGLILADNNHGLANIVCIEKFIVSSGMPLEKKWLSKCLWSRRWIRFGNVLWINIIIASKQ